MRRSGVAFSFPARTRKFGNSSRPDMRPVVNSDRIDRPAWPTPSCNCPSMVTATVALGTGHYGNQITTFEAPPLSSKFTRIARYRIKPTHCKLRGPNQKNKLHFCMPIKAETNQQIGGGLASTLAQHRHDASDCRMPTEHLMSRLSSLN